MTSQELADKVQDLLLKPVLTVEEAGIVMNLSKNTAYKAVNEGDIPAHRVGGQWRIPTAKLKELLGITE